MSSAAPGSEEVSRILAEEGVEDVGPGAERSGRDAPAALKRISVSKEPGRIWDNSAKRDEAPDPVPAADEDTRVLLRPSLEADPTIEDAAPQPIPDPRHIGQARVPQATWGSSTKDHLSYAEILLRAVWWRTTAHLAFQWRSLERAFRARGAESPAVRRRLPFFLSTLILGSTGRMGPFGLREAANRVVLEDAWAVFNRFFRADDAATEAFSRFLARAQIFNPNRRVTQFRKIVTTGLLGAAVLGTAELPAYFDSLASAETGRSLLEFQAGPQQTALKLFTGLVQETILEMNAGLPPGRRIVGALLMGSFANGAAGPSSDLDLQTIAEKGSSAHIGAFYSKLDAKWEEAGMRNPISDYQYALPLSKTLITHLHREHYLILSPYPEVVAGLQRTSVEEITDRPARVRGIRGVAFHLFYVAWLTAVLTAFRAWTWLRETIGKPLPDVPPGH
jgi:predicted nucleotidyltransferase